MKAIHLAAMAILFVVGSLSTACAQAHDDRPFREPDPPGQDERRMRQIKELEAEIAKLEGEIKGADDQRRDELKKIIGDRRMRLEELRRGGKRPPPPFGDDPEPKIARLERHMHELKMKLDRDDLGPEERKELSVQLDRARAQMEELRAQAKMQDPMRRGPGPGPMGPPPDPETQKMLDQAAELERQCMDIGAKLRRGPKENKEDREKATVALKESVTRLFEVREKLRAREVEMLKKRLEELTDLLEKRKANRDAIIEKRIRQLLGEADPLDW